MALAAKYNLNIEQIDTTAFLHPALDKDIYGIARHIQTIAMVDQNHIHWSTVKHILRYINTTSASAQISYNKYTNRCKCVPI